MMTTSSCSQLWFIAAVVAICQLHSCCYAFVPTLSSIHTHTTATTTTTHTAHRPSRGSRSIMTTMTISKAPQDTTVAVAGATGYIGKFVVRECVRQGYKTIAICRDAESAKNTPQFQGAEVVQGDVTNPEQLDTLFNKHNINAVVSCLASRSGTKSDSFAIDYQATSNCLKSALKAKAEHFVMLSAFCVQKPLLQFQKAKLKFEAELTKAGDAGLIGYSIVRPTAFFKSVSGQLEIVQGGAPFVVFGDGSMCKCNPISEADLSTYLVNCLSDKKLDNRILPLGGPDDGITMEQQGVLLAEAVGKEPWIIKAPVGLFDAIIGGLDAMSKLFPSFEDAAELARIGKYYAVEDMLTTQPEEKFGTTTLKQHYERIAVEGQEADPYTTILGSKK